ncbi:MAG: antibiotic biosynthesis monooxygenase, partial [Campylobacteraceae bacterium]|nr:antibiotic biosynthesis monooxygenase [Campylobacteraceae bacterium]
FLIAKVLPKTEHFEDAKTALLDIIEQTLQEDGCIQFELYDDKKYLYLYEESIDENALSKHYEEPYTKVVFDKYQKWLLEPVEVMKMEKSSTILM